MIAILIPKERSRISLGLQRAQLLMTTNNFDFQEKQRVFLKFMQHLFGALANHAFVINEEKEHLYSAQGPNQSHLTPLFSCELSYESGQHVCECMVV